MSRTDNLQVKWSKQKNEIISSLGGPKSYSYYISGLDSQ